MTRRPNPPRTPARQQRGITMFVAIIILIMVTLLAVSSFRGSNTNLKVVSSMQGRQEAIASAQAGTEDLISLTRTRSAACYAAPPGCHRMGQIQARGRRYWRVFNRIYQTCQDSSDPVKRCASAWVLRLRWGTYSRGERGK